MKIGTVMGEVQLEKRLPGYENVRFCQVRLTQEVVVAADLLSTRQGDLVLLTQGKAARAYSMEHPCDALILGILENRKNG